MVSGHSSWGALELGLITILGMGMGCAGRSTGPEVAGGGGVEASAVDEHPDHRVVTSVEYGADPRFPEALAPGDAAPEATLPTGDGPLSLTELLGAGPVVLVWVGGAEHRASIAWVEALCAALAEFEARGASVVLARPGTPEAALRWAQELGLQVPVVGDARGDLRVLLGLRDEATTPLDRGAWILRRGEQGPRVVYRKLGLRPPQLAELLAVLDGQGEGWRCLERQPRAGGGAACVLEPDPR